jgi:hypothetical protein
VGDELLYVTNTESDVVRAVSTQALYVLIAGRWYTAPTPAGPWTFVRGDQLPPAFGRVPPDSPKGNILASVAGTDQADDAIADSEIPQTSAIQRDDTGFQVAYDGPPEFDPIAGTGLRYAVNADAEVIFADGRYYACDQGVWYVADNPDGPWRVSETRPIGVEDIPPSCPVYDVRYVYIYDVTPGYIYMGYLPGYLGCYPYYGTVVYGTGYHYRGWRGRRHYYPRPCTWGFQPRYNPWLGRWGFGYTFSSGFLRTGIRWRRAPQVGHPHSPPPWFGPGGFRRPQVGTDLTLLRTRRPGRLPARPADIAPMNLYRRTSNVGRVNPTASRLPLRPIVPTPARPVARPNNVFAGRDGKVYQRDNRGNWQVNDGRVWKPARTPDRAPATPMPARPGGRGSEAGSSWPGAQPRPQPFPPASGEPRVQPRSVPSPRPAAPVIRPEPGNLEREFRARQRSNAENPPATTPPAAKPEPARPSPKKPPFGHKP